MQRGQKGAKIHVRNFTPALVSRPAAWAARKRSLASISGRRASFRARPLCAARGALRLRLRTAIERDI